MSPALAVKLHGGCLGDSSVIQPGRLSQEVIFPSFARYLQGV